MTFIITLLVEIIFEGVFLKFAISEKHTKFCAIFLMLCTFTNNGARTVLEIDSDCVLECTLSRNSFDFKMHCNLLWPSLKAFPSITCDPVRNTNYAKLRDCLKVRKFQNEFMKSSFLPTYEPNNVRISALYCAKQHDRNPYNFWFIFWEER